MKPMKPMEPMQPMQPMQPMKGLADDPASRWWPESLGTSPNSAGGQNEMRYAYFGGKHRLAVDTGSGVSVYDTDEHEVSGVQQQQDGGGKKVVFTSQKGEVDLGALKKVGA